MQYGSKPQYTSAMARAIKDALREAWGLAPDETSTNPAHDIDSHKIAVAAYDALMAEQAAYPPSPTGAKDNG